MTILLNARSDFLRLTPNTLMAAYACTEVKDGQMLCLDCSFS